MAVAGLIAFGQGHCHGDDHVYDHHSSFKPAQVNVVERCLFPIPSTLRGPACEAALAPSILDTRGATMLAMKSVFDRWPNPVSLLAPMLLALAAASCVSKANPVLPSGGNPPSGGLAGSGGLDSGAGDALPGSDVQEDAGDSNESNGPCDLLTYMHTQKGCPTSPILQACYPISGSGRCQDAGSQGLLNPCVPGDTTGDSTVRCAPGLACIPDPNMGPICLFLCDTNQQACDGGSSCVRIGPTSTVGTCQL